MADIKIAIVDDDPEFLKALSVFLNSQEGLIVVGAAGSKEEIIRLHHSIDINIVLMDINLSPNHMDGIEAAKILIKSNSRIKVIMLTAFLNEDLVIRSFNNGAVEYIPKEHYKILPELIRMVCERKSSVEVLLENKREFKLSPTEKELLQFLKEGKKPKEVCMMLHKSPQTVKNQITSINRKLKVGSYKEAIKKVANMNLLK